MANKKTDFQVTVGYKACVCFSIKAETEEEARKKAIDIVRDKGIYEGDMQDEWFKVAGVLNMDDSWNMVQS
jgi:hypothetical protein